MKNKTEPLQKNSLMLNESLIAFFLFHRITVNCCKFTFGTFVGPLIAFLPISHCSLSFFYYRTFLRGQLKSIISLFPFSVPGQVFSHLLLVYSIVNGQKSQHQVRLICSSSFNNCLGTSKGQPWIWWLCINWERMCRDSIQQLFSTWSLVFPHSCCAEWFSYYT